MLIPNMHLLITLSKNMNKWEKDMKVISSFIGRAYLRAHKLVISK